MKTQIFIFIGLLLLYLSNISINKVVAQENTTTENTISIVMLLLICTISQIIGQMNFVNLILK